MNKNRLFTIFIFMAIVISIALVGSVMAAGNTCEETTGVHPCDDGSGGSASNSFLSENETASQFFALTETSQSASSSGAKILLLADTAGAGTPALVNALTAAGHTVTVHAPEFTWNGSPALSNFDGVIHLNGSTYYSSLSPTAQGLLSDFVKDGHFWIGSQWDGYARRIGSQTAMNDLVLQLHGDVTSDNCSFCNITYTAVAGQSGHPVLAGIPASFSFAADGHDAGDQVSFNVDPSTVLMRSQSGGPGVLVRNFGSGCVVNFSHAANYIGSSTLQDGNIQQLYLNSVDWAQVSGCAGNTPPTADSGGLYSGVEGSAIGIDGSGSDDADGDVLTYAWSYVDGSGVDAGASCTFGSATAVTTTITCTDDGTYNLTLTVYDGNGAQDSSSTAVDVTNDDPDASVPTVDQTVIPVGTTISASAGFADDGSNDTHEVEWDWGDGGTTDPASTATPAMAGHMYNTPGIYTVSATLTDDDGGSDTEAFEFVVVYDPEGGFVTGGGWIDSPAGALVDNPAATGKANFGFVSKYQRGATTPTGQTEFQFKAGDLDFHSSSYDWLVVAGQNQAKYKGVGTINGTGNYGFMLTAVDNGSSGDTFRIKIWDIDNGDAPIYDNQSAEGDDSYAGTVIGGGNIKVHKK